MKKKNTNYKLFLRLIAGIAVSLVLVAATVILTQGDTGSVNIGGNAADSDVSLYKRTAGVEPTDIVMTVDGQDVSAEDYLYWLSYYCDYYSEYLNYMDVSNWDTPLSEGGTVGEYIAQQSEMQAQSILTQYAVIDNWANEIGITLTEDDMADIQAQRADSIAQLGSEEAYLQWLDTLGISDEFITRSLAHSYLTNHLYDTYCDANSTLHPDKKTLKDYTDAKEYLAASILFVDTTEMDDAEKSAVLKTMKGYAATLQKSKDIDKTFGEIAAELGAEDTITTFTPDEVEEKVTIGVKRLYMNTASNVITTDSGYYVLVRRFPGEDRIIRDMLNEEFAQRCANAQISYNDEIYSTIDTLSFYKNLLETRVVPEVQG